MFDGQVRAYSKAQQLGQKPKDTPNYKPQRHKKMKKKPSMRTRKNFSKQVRQQAWDYWDGLCANCRSARPDDPHHIRARSSNGKGVFTNCLPVCRPCHDKIERDAELRQSWKEWAKKTWGVRYWCDEWDVNKK